MMRAFSSGKLQRRVEIQRRTFLKGAGVALLLPRLESLGQAEEKSPRRLLTIVNHLSFYQPELIPKTDGAFENPPPLLAELSDHFKQLKIFSGLNNPAVQNGLGTPRAWAFSPVTSISCTARIGYPLTRRWLI